MKILTKAEEEVMQILWKLNNAFVKDIIREFQDPKPAYNTISTIVRILESKGFVEHESFGKSHRYAPIISKDEYSNQYMKSFLSRYFEGSFEKMLSFFAKENDISVEDLDTLMKNIKNKSNED